MDGDIQEDPTVVLHGSNIYFFKLLFKCVFLNGNGKQEICKNPAMPGTPYYFLIMLYKCSFFSKRDSRRLY
jgi:hypothetical protein